MSEFTPLREAVDALASRPSPDFGELKRRAARRGRRRFALVAVATVAVITGSAVVAADLSGDRQTGPVTPVTSSPPATPTPTTTTTPAGDTNLITVKDVDDVYPYVPGNPCPFPITVTTVAQVTTYDDGEQLVALSADESVTVTNTDNKKVFDATGDNGLVNKYNDDRSQADTRMWGPIMWIGVFTLPGEDKKQSGIFFVKGEVEARQHNVDTLDHWLEITKITGTQVDVCSELK